jgi:hypothetical protein
MKKFLFFLFFAASALGASAQAVEHTLQLKTDGCQGDVYINIGDPTALDELEPSLSVYPNPVTDVLNIPVNAPGRDVNIFLLDVRGKVLQQKLVSGNEPLCRLMMAHEPAGIYFVLVIDTKETVYKIIKN